MPCLSRFALLLAALLCCAPVLSAPPPPGVVRAEITGLVYRPDGKVVYSASMDGSVCAHDVRTGQITDYALDPNGNIQALAVAPGGKMLATAHGSNKFVDNKVRLWDATRLTVTTTLAGHGDTAAAVAFSPDGKILASGGYDGVIRLWEVETGKELRNIEVGNRVTGLAWAPDGKTLASAGSWRNPMQGNLPIADSNAIVLWDPQTGLAKKKLPCHGTNVAFSPDGRMILAGGQGVFPVKPGEPAQLIINRAALRSVNRIVLFDLVADAEVAEIEGQGNALAISGDGRFVVTGRGSERHTTGMPGSVHIGLTDPTRVPTLRERCTGQPVVRNAPVEANGIFRVLALSTDGLHLATGDAHGIVRITDLTPRPAVDVLADPERLWLDLAGDADKAYPLALALAADPARAVPLLRERLRPKPRDAVRARKLITDLDDEEFMVREAASRELARLGTAAEPELRQAEKGALSVEARHRVEALLAPLNAATVPLDQLRAVRAILALERAATPEARAVLTTLAADGEPLPAREAHAALQRMGR